MKMNSAVNFMKKLLSVFLVVLLVFSFASCKGKEKTEEKKYDDDYSVTVDESGNLVIKLYSNAYLGYVWECKSICPFVDNTEMFYDYNIGNEELNETNQNTVGIWNFTYAPAYQGEGDLNFKLTNYSDPTIDIGSFVNVHVNVDENLKITAEVTDVEIVDTTEYDKQFGIEAQQ